MISIDYSKYNFNTTLQLFLMSIEKKSIIGFAIFLILLDECNIKNLKAYVDGIRQEVNKN